MTHFAEADYWKECDFIKWSKSIFSNSSTSINDVRALCELGLPEWAAPNINFDMYDIHNGILKIGEDRDDRDILLNLNSLNISISDNQLLVNTSPHKLRASLKLYAFMVEKAIASDEEAFVENRVSQQLVDELKNGLKKLDPECLSGKSFWIDEIKRLKKKLVNMKNHRIIDLLNIQPSEIISGDEATKIAQNWLAAFCPTKRSFKGIKRFKTYMWDLMDCDLEKEDAFVEYDRLEAPKYIIMEDCFGQDKKEVYVVEKKPSNNYKLKDFHVYPKNLAWSMAFTHEDGWVGPKLAKHRDFDKLNTKNKRAIEVISRAYD